MSQNLEDVLWEGHAAGRYGHFGLIDSRFARTVTFLDDERFARVVIENRNIAALLTTGDLELRMRSARPDIELLVASDPRLVFFKAYNRVAAARNAKAPASEVHESARVHPSAFVSEAGVTIGANTVIEPLAKVLAGSRIGVGVVVRAGSTIGAEGFEHKRVSFGILSVVHDGLAVLEDGVEIGANNTVARGLMGEDTVVGAETKTDCLVHIAHCAKVGKRCLLAASAMVAGSAVIEDDCWIGPNASVSSQVRIGKGASVTLGAVAMRDVAPGTRVSGNFAVEHSRFLAITRFLQRSTGKRTSDDA